MPNCLYRIRMDQCAVLMSDSRDFRNRLDRSHFIIRGHHGNQTRTRPHRLSDLLRRNEPAFVRPDISHRITHPFKRRAAIQNRVMLDFRCNDVALLLQRPRNAE